MKDFYEKLKNDLPIRMAFLWFCLFTCSSLCTAIITAFYGMRWVELDTQDRLMVCLLVFSNWAQVMMAFFSKAIARAQKGEFPIAEGDTQMISRTTQVTQQTTEVKTP